ncbi:tumor necrosis factor receptor superfamily member 10B-like [Podargus strigoides]
MRTAPPPAFVWAAPRPPRFGTALRTRTATPPLLSQELGILQNGACARVSLLLLESGLQAEAAVGPALGLASLAPCVPHTEERRAGGNRAVPGTSALGCPVPHGHTWVNQPLQDGDRTTNTSNVCLDFPGFSGCVWLCSSSPLTKNNPKHQPEVEFPTSQLRGTKICVTDPYRAVPGAVLTPGPCPPPRSPRSAPRKMCSALHGALRRHRHLLLLLLLLLVTEAALRSAAAALDRRDKLDPLYPSRGEEEFYKVPDSDRYCRKCPAGRYVSEHCKEQNGSSTCLPCKKDEFIEYPNDFTKCLGCRTCREDQVELSPCRAVSNTQCACRNGTFCSPDHPCEMCQKCRPWCPKGEVEQAPCTPHSDRQCGPPTSTFSGSSNNLIGFFVVLGIVFLVLFLFCLWRCCCRRSPGDGRDLGGKSCSMVDTLLRQLTRHQRGTQDNRRNERFCQDQLLPRTAGSGPPSAPGPEVMSPRTSCPNVKPRRSLVPVQGKDPAELLRCSFGTFVQEVPYKDWKRYGRALDLLENDIAAAEMEDKYPLEPFYQMLNTWRNRQGMNASVNTLLEALHRINLGGIAEDISSKLVQQGCFQYEVSVGTEGAAPDAQQLH